MLLAVQLQSSSHSQYFVARSTLVDDHLEIVLLAMQDDVGSLRVWHAFRTYSDSALVDPDVVALQSEVLRVVKNQVAIYFQVVQNRRTDVQQQIPLVRHFHSRTGRREDLVGPLGGIRPDPYKVLPAAV